MKNKIYFIILIILFLALIHVEFVLNQKYAPESLLIKVRNPQGIPEENADCKADISSMQVNVEDKALKGLNSIYDFVNPNYFYHKDGDKGYYLLSTNFSKYKGDYNIKVVCYSPGFRGVSYTIINNSNTNCEFKENGKFVVC